MIMQKQSIKDLKEADILGKDVLVRVDFNVPIQNGVITDDSRIQAAIPTIQYILNKGGRCILASHLGRPKGVADPALSLKIVGKQLERLLGQTVATLDDCIGPEVVNDLIINPQHDGCNIIFCRHR